MGFLSGLCSLACRRCSALARQSHFEPFYSQRCAPLLTGYAKRLLYSSGNSLMTRPPCLSRLCCSCPLQASPFYAEFCQEATSQPSQASIDILANSGYSIFQIALCFRKYPQNRKKRGVHGLSGAFAPASAVPASLPKGLLYSPPSPS